MPIGSSTLVDTRVYAQDTQPTDERDGILWVDTGTSGRPTFVYDAGSGSWEDVAANLSGMILAWSGAIADIPSGWVICDGANGTPDLATRFIRHADGTTITVGDIAGLNSVTLSESEMPSHSHSVEQSPDDSTTGDTYVASDGTSNPTNSYPTSTRGGDSSHSNLPRYHALAYIMKV